MKLKLSFLAGALALAVTGQASAAINGNSATGNGDLILSIWDTTTQTSYTRDLGVSLDVFLAGPVVNGGASFVVGDGGNGGVSSAFAADATLTSFLAGVNAATTSWNIVAMDSTGAGANGTRILSTTNVAPSALSNAGVKAFVASPNVYMAAANVLSGANSSVTATVADGSAYAGGTVFNNNFGGSSASSFTNDAGLGVSQNFYFMTPSSASGIAAATVGQFSNAAGASTWTLASNGALNYTVAAVPEPGEWALMLSGFGLIGFIATRRRNMNTGMMNIA
jgi:hypothetical protein